MCVIVLCLLQFNFQVIFHFKRGKSDSQWSLYTFLIQSDTIQQQIIPTVILMGSDLKGLKVHFKTENTLSPSL